MTPMEKELQCQIKKTLDIVKVLMDRVDKLEKQVHDLQKNDLHIGTRPGSAFA